MYTVKDKIIAIYNFNENTEANMKLDFVESVESFLSQRDFVTEKQEQAIDNIIRRFHIKLEDWII